MENGNSQEFGLDMEEYNKFLRSIKAGSPVHKINFTIETPNAAAGMYLLTKDDFKSYINEATDLTDVSDNTLLVFESRHVIECCQIIYGCLTVLNNMGLLRKDCEDIIGDIIDALLTKPIYYTTFTITIDHIVIAAIHVPNSKETNEVFERIRYIFKNIWFIPYGKIDEIASEAIKEYKERYKVGDNNE